MLPLWWFGRMYQAEVGSRKLLSTYVMGGLAGVATVILAVNYLGSFEAYANNGIVGASAAVFAIMTAMASLHPNRKSQLRFIWHCSTTAHCNRNNHHGLFR